MNDIRIMRLAKSFPSLREAPGVQPWQPQVVARWTHGPIPSLGGIFAARFLLSWWGYVAIEPFDLHAALSVWDDEHRQAFQNWVMAPWWP